MKNTCGVVMYLVSALFLLILSAVNAFAFDVSGTVTSSYTDRVYLSINTQNGRVGTSIAPSDLGAFTISGVPAGTNYTVSAFADKLNTGSRHASDPAGMSTSFNVSANVSSVSVSLTSPSAITTVPMPSRLIVLPSDNSALVMWGGNNNGQGEQADSYSLFWSTSSDVVGTYTSQGGGSLTNIPATGDMRGLILTNSTTVTTGSSIANSSTLYFAVKANIGATASPAYTIPAPVTINPSTTGNSVSGQVTFPTVTNGKPLMVALVDSSQVGGPPSQIYMTKLTSPGSPQPYIITGVPNGSYRVYAFFDLNGNNLIDAGDLNITDATAPVVTVTGTVSNANVTLSATGSAASVKSNRWKNATTESFGLNFEIVGKYKRPVKVSLISGPNVSVPIDIALDDYGRFNSWTGIGTTVPLVGDAYVFNVTYLDGSSDTSVTGSVTGVISSYATPVSPVGSLTFNAAPVFNWTAPATLPSYYGYRMSLKQQNGGLYWDPKELPGTQLSANFNFDNQASSSALQDNTAYYWEISVFDATGNSATQQLSFSYGTPIGNAITITTSMLPNATVGNSYSQNFYANGGSASLSWSVLNGTLPTGLSLTPAGAFNGTPTASGSYSFTIKATDLSNASNFSTMAYTMTVNVSGAVSSVSFIGGVQDCSTTTCVNLQGVTITTVGLSPELTATSDAIGLFTFNIPLTTTLSSQPATAPFYIIISKAGFVNSASSQIQLTGPSNSSDRPYSLYPSSKLTDWGITAGSGVIHSRVVDAANLATGYITGAIVTATTSAGAPLPVEYIDTTGAVVANGSTYSNGKYIVRNIPAATQVTVTASAPAYTSFQPRTFTVYADTISQGRISGTTTSLSFTGGVQDCSAATCINLQGVTVTTVGLTPELTATSDASGLFTLNVPTTTTVNSLPATASFHLVLSKALFINTASAQMQLTASTNVSDRPYSLYFSSILTQWANTTGTGVIMSRVVSSADPVYGYLAGATVTATTANGSLPVAYMDGTGAILAMATTDGTGRFIIRNIPTGTLVTVTATAPNYTNFQVKQYAVNANTVSQGRISGVLTTSVDSQAPSVPTGLNAQAVNSNQINVSWNTASDNVGVVGYKVYRNGVLVSQPSGANNTFWSNYSLFPSVAYSYTVSACDAANNCSLQSPSVSATTPNAATSGPVTITGSITYSGTRTGRVFVSIPTNSGTLGTSVAWPAGTTTVPYTIRGVPSSNTSNTISAFMDILDNGTQSASSPAGSSASGATATTRDLTLINPTLAAPATPTYVEVKPGPTSVFIMWQPNRVNGVVDADYYDVYWNTSASVSPTNASGSKLGVTAGMDSPLVINSLTNGTSYYFVVVPRAGALTGSASTAVGPVIVGAATGLNTVSGTVTYNGTIPANAALYVAVVPGGNNKGMGNLFYTKYPNPSASQPFNISGIPDGGYQVYVILDMNNDGLFASGDISNTNSELAPTIVLAGNSGASGITIPLVSKNSEVVISTDHRKNVTNGDSYNVDGSITRQLKRPVAVTLTAVPASSTLSVPMDMGFGSDNGKGLQFWTGNSTRPTIGDLYTFTIKYSDNTEDVGVTGAVTGVLDNFPVNQSLLNPVSTIPTFNWMAPATAPTGNYQYSLWVGSSNTNNNNKLWEAWNIPSTQLSIIYGSGDSSSPILAIGTNYAWNIGVRDQKGNRATIDGLTFSPTITGVSDTTAPTIISTTPANNATGVSINTSISVTFSEIVKGMPELTAAVKNNTTGLYISGTGTESVDRKTQKFTPSTPLTPGTTYSIQFAAVTDLAGNPLPVTTLTFTTAAATPLDTNPPVTTASLAGGVYYTTQSVTLTPSETAKVYFTTDDSTPTTSSTQFSGPISITSTTTLKFYSVDTAGNSEQIINSIQYIIVPSGDINGDGKIDLADAQRMLGIAVGRIQGTAADLKNADVAPLINGLPAPDGTIGIGDVVVVLRRIVGSVTW